MPMSCLVFWVMQRVTVRDRTTSLCYSFCYLVVSFLCLLLSLPDLAVSKAAVPRFQEHGGHLSPNINIKVRQQAQI